jgi:hypothetical protein
MYSRFEDNGLAELSFSATFGLAVVGARIATSKEKD